MNGKGTPAFTDSPEQAAVIGAPVGGDVLVVAGAGSGKTYTMTRRIIGLIEQGVPPERILGLTFTRKAASELLSRVSSAVSDHDRGSVRSAFLKPEVSTYDAFFQSIVRQYGLLVGFDQNTQPLSDAGAMQLAATVIDRHMDLLFDDDFGSFRTVVGKVLALSHAIGNAMIGGRTATIDEAIARIRQWDAAFIAQLDVAIGDAEVPGEEPKTKAPKRNKNDTDRQYAAKQAEYRAALHDLCVYRCSALRDVVRRRETLMTLVAEYEREKRRQNMAEFSDFTIAAYQLVTRFPSIGERYRRRYTHVLLDEYQDTSTTQAMVLAALFHAQREEDTDPSAGVVSSAGVAQSVGTVQSVGTAPNDGGADLAGDGTGPTGGANPARTGRALRSAVNAVGDPFQSIYAWRGASPGAFRMFQRDFGMAEGTRPFPLSVTRRNSRIVLEAANHLTGPLRVPPRRAGSSLMREVDVAELTTLDDAPEGTIGVLGLTTFGQEIDAVARFAKQAIARYTPTERQRAGGAKDIRPHVAVLFRGKTHMAQFARGLERAGLSTLVVGYSALLERPDVRDLLALMHAVADHTDSNALMRLLATPRFGLRSADLTALADLAERLDTAYRYRALAEAGLIDAGGGADADGGVGAADEARQAAIVREYRDQVPHAVYLADLLARKDLADLLRRGAIAGAAADAIVRAGRMIRRVQAVANHPLNDVVRTAVEELGLDIDMIVAQAIEHPDQPVNPTAARSGTDAIIALVDTYAREIVEGATPTLRGFMAWVDSLGSVDEESAAAPDTPADVVLMTIHQSKGLEWDAVVVAGMAAGTFPSNQSGLKITADADHAGGMTPEGAWIPPEYHTDVATWLDDPAAVPVPVRVDAGILPRFPHDAAPHDDPLHALTMLDDVEVIDDEIYGDMRGKDIGDDMDAVDPDGWYLTQGEEYGRRLLADERRLAYVALTRARYDALLTYSKYPTEDRDPRPLLERGGRKPNASKPSVFWDEVRDSLCHRADVVAVNGRRDDGDAQASGGAATRPASAPEPTTSPSTLPSAPQSLDEAGADRPDGFFAGERAGDYESAVVEAAWREPLEPQPEETSLPWPASLSASVLGKLIGGVGAMGLPGAQARTEASPGSGPDTSGMGSGAVAPDTDRNDAGEPEGSGGPSLANATPVLPAKESLLARAQLLVNDPDLMPWPDGDARDLDARVRRQAERLLSGGRQNVTSLQARAGHLNERDARALWRGLVRPIPHVASPSAEAGTIFHAWAEQFITAFGGGEVADAVVSAGAADDAATTGPTGAGVPSRESMIADLDAREAAAAAGEPLDGEPRQLLAWQRRLVSSRWASRRPAWAERQLVVAIPQLGNTIVNGKLDAVFYGGLDADDTAKRFTIVDWKTGRKPRTARDIEDKLVQLDWYRLLLSVIENVPLDSIDATLYYLSEPDEGARELTARAKTEQEILAELSSGIPKQSDND